MTGSLFLRSSAGRLLERVLERPSPSGDANREAPAAAGDPGGGVAFLSRLYELSSGSSRMRSMEGLRGLAVLLVFFVHTNALFGAYVRGIPLLHGPSDFLGAFGNSGVDLFFVLSGFLIYAALLRHRAGIAAFLSRRIERIYPAFLAVFALYLVLSWLFPAESKIGGRSLGATLLYLIENVLLLPGMFDIRPIITVAWSLSYEFFFYIAAALFVAGVRPWRWRARSRVILVGCVWAGDLVYSFSRPTSHVRLSMFLVGMLLYEALGSERFRGWLKPRGEAAVIALAMAAAVFVYLLEIQSSRLNFLPGKASGRDSIPGIFVYQGPYTALALGISMFLAAAFALGAGGRLQRAFTWTPLRYLGNMSYSFYLIHGVTLQGIALAADAAVRRGAPGSVVFLLAVSIGFGAAWLSSTVLFAAIEKPLSLQRSVRRARPEREVVHQ
jgi:exopolysaccharide production protein ExoZ